MTPRRLLALAGEVRGGVHPLPPGVAHRVVAMLARRALEDAVQAALGLGPEAAVPFTSQLHALEATRAPEVARRAALVWSALSRVCHFHGYELPPTQAELDGWLAEVEGIVGALLERSPDRGREERGTG